ncbi:CDP-diacylglycerol diphosphatase [Microbispora sp. RL4-1S]|uniref:CDP-diacylglycerol diphosphatase n=1 Tax=Microbispora oryzae TaxID=2806554 RepID=A0A941AL42_9ACTN|nr:CDP-diacylglycerol diphosphatase [Microbispora oryzae]MBP2708175.1 CDP-diacylglycerol diphosphatase [Microbispora oryzae]
MCECDRAGDETNGLTRRRFVQFSGLAGVGAIAGAGIFAGAEHASAAPPPHPKGPDPKQCGSTALSSDSLWRRSQTCHANNSCLQNDTDYVVMGGNNNKSGYVNFILVPTVRISGIECPWICGGSAPNYWSAADYYAGKAPTVVPNPVGLGINSKAARHFNQLHIHMARARPESMSDLAAHEATAARTVANWADSRVSVRGYSENLGIVPHTYRVLVWPGFAHDNLFAMLRTMLVHALGHGATTAKAQERMVLQTLIVIPRKAGGYYVVNGEGDLRDPNNPQLTGSATCDPLLLMHP